MALRNPLDAIDALGFGTPRQAQFLGPATQAPPMPAPGFGGALGPAPGQRGGLLPPGFGGGQALDRFSTNHPRASGFLADNSNALLYGGLQMLAGNGNPRRAWSGLAEGMAYGSQRDDQRRDKADEAAKQEEWAAILAEVPMDAAQRRVLEMLGPDGGAEALFNMLSQEPEGPDYGFEDMGNGTLVRTDSNAGTAETVLTVPQPADSTATPSDWQLYQLAIQQYPKGQAPTYDEWDLQRRGRLGGIVTEDDALRAGLVEGEAVRWGAMQQQGTKSSAALNDLELLSELSLLAPEGPITGRLAQMVGPGFSTAGDAFRAIVQRVAPTLRAEGSGSTSDIEYAGMLASLPQLTQTNEARQAIISIMQAKARLDLERADVVRQFINNDLTAEQARNQLSEIDSRSIMTAEMRGLFGLPETPAASSAPGGGALPADAPPDATHYNADTGEYIRWDEQTQQWVPVQ